MEKLSKILKGNSDLNRLKKECVFYESGKCSLKKDYKCHFCKNFIKK